MWEWIWNNLSNIDSILNVLLPILSVCTFIRGLIEGVIKLKLKRNPYKYLNLVVNKQTKRSMKYYIPTRVQEVDPCDDACTTDSSKKIIPYFINEVFKNSDTQYFVILADSGMGKTTFLLKLFYEYYRRLLKKYDIVFIPLLFDSSLEWIKEIQNKPNTILLLDGLDEDTEAIKDYNKRLRDICRETELFYKVIISCRTQFFPDSDSEPRYTNRIRFGVGNKSVEFIKYYISFFNEREINIYLSKKYNPILERNKIKRSKKIIRNCPELMIRPMLLAYIDDLIDDKEKEYNYVYEIYDQLVNNWIARELIDNETLYRFSEKTAEYMYFNKTVYIKVSEIQKNCEEYGIQLSDLEAKSRSLLNRNANGIYKFAHKSILEFILAKKAIKDAQFRKVIVLNGFAGYDMLKLFLGEMSVSYVKKILEINNDILENRVFDFLLLSEIDFSNTKIINCCFEGCNLSKAVFRGVNFGQTSLKDGNLREADLFNANLKGIDLRGTNLVRANLQEADLRGAKLSLIRLNDAILKGTKFDENQIGQIENYICNLQEVKIYIEKENRFIDYEEFCRRNGKRK